MGLWLNSTCVRICPLLLADKLLQLVFLIRCYGLTKGYIPCELINSHLIRGCIRLVWGCLIWHFWVKKPTKISQQWDGAGSWNPCSQKLRTIISYLVTTVAQMSWLLALPVYHKPCIDLVLTEYPGFSTSRINITHSIKFYLPLCYWFVAFSQSISRAPGYISDKPMA